MVNEIKLPNADTQQKISNDINSSIKKYPKSLLKWEKTNLDLVGLLGTSWDGNIYGFASNVIFKSTDGGATKTSGFSFPAQFGQPFALYVFPDGIVIISEDTSVSPVKGYITRATDLNTPPTLIKEISDTKLPTISNSAYYDGLNSYVLVGEYGHTVGARTLWLSKDAGLTFNAIKITTITNATQLSHWHNATFDPYTGSIYATQGDSENAYIYVSRDFGVTWSMISDNNQPTCIAPFPKYVCFGNDEAWLKPGMTRIKQPKTVADYSSLVVEEAFSFQPDYRGDQFYPERPVYANNLEAYIIFGNYSDQATKSKYIFATGDGGESWHSVYFGHNTIGYLSVDKNGYIYATAKGSLYKSKLVEWVNH